MFSAGWCPGQAGLSHTSFTVAWISREQVKLVITKLQSNSYFLTRKNDRHDISIYVWRRHRNSCFLFCCGFISHLIDGYTINMSKPNAFTVFFFDTFWDRGDYLERNGIILGSLGYRSNHHIVCCCSNKLQIASSHEASYIKHHTWFIRKPTRRAACWSWFHACLKEISWNCNIYICILSWEHCLPNFKLTFDLLFFYHDILAV